MRSRIPLLVGFAFAASFGVGLWAAPSRVATLPPYDPAADVGKIPAIASSGFIGWSTAAAVSGAVVGPNSSANDDLAAFDGLTGKLIKDSGIPSANVVLVSRAVQAGTGLTVTNSGLLTADITMSLSSATGSTGPLATITTQTTKGDLIGFSTLPVRVAVGTTGATLVADSTATAGVSWLGLSYLEAGPSGAQSVTGSNVPFTWKTVTADPASNITLSSNGAGPTSTRINVAAAGNYLFTGNGEWSSNSTGQRIVFIDLNTAGAAGGSVHYCLTMGNANSNSDVHSINFSCIIRLAAGGYAEVFGNQTSGSTLTTRTDAFGPRLFVQRLSP